MNTYVKLKTVLHIIDLVMSDCEIKHKGKAIRKRLKELPTEDVVKVVRCKNCELFKPYSDPLKGFYGECMVRESDIGENDFCSYGVRKEGAENG